ncbi:trace amine-associated receptor 8c-like [Dysidea avara]|uniref:trace amine-associated receptor 8c-like n=1 Tax=Dysidea avara TaxID=196820 RepID=UPI00332215C8
MEGSGEFSELSGSGIDPGVTAPDQLPGSHLPGYFAYLSLGFKLISTLIIVLMAGWVFMTIKTTKKLHKPHNIWVANLMATDVITVMVTTIQTSAMMIGFATGVGDFIPCHVFKFLLFPVVVLNATYLIISVDKVVAITFPFKHRRMMTPRAIAGIIAVTWLLPMLLFVHTLFNADGFIKVAQYGTCISTGSAFVEALFTYMLPIFTAAFLSLVLNIHLSMKAYRIHKQIESETSLRGFTNDLEALKTKQATIKKNLKPVTTLLVVVLGSTAIGLLTPLLYIPVSVLAQGSVYNEVVRLVIGPNVGYIVLLLHPLVYGLYFKQVREPMMKLLKGTLCANKFNSAAVAPQPRRMAWM